MVLTILKNMKVNGKDDIPYMKWKIKAMFETTNQYNMCLLRIFPSPHPASDNMPLVAQWLNLAVARMQHRQQAEVSTLVNGKANSEPSTIGDCYMWFCRHTLWLFNIAMENHHSEVETGSLVPNFYHGSAV